MLKVIPVQSFGSHIRPQPPGVELKGGGGPGCEVFVSLCVVGGGCVCVCVINKMNTESSFSNNPDFCAIYKISHTLIFVFLSHFFLIWHNTCQPARNTHVFPSLTACLDIASLTECSSFHKQELWKYFQILNFIVIFKGTAQQNCLDLFWREVRKYIGWKIHNSFYFLLFLLYSSHSYSTLMQNMHKLIMHIFVSNN